LIKKGLLERISLGGLARMLAIKPYQIYRYINELYSEISDDLGFKVLDLPIEGDFDLFCIETQLMKHGVLYKKRQISNGFGRYNTEKVGK